jgi:O6-methylguanine-DNA--protein-cysteine methyltransferase
LSPATFSRIFTDGSEDNNSFSYDYTLVPLARTLLDVETIDADDTDDVKVLKEMLKIKHTRIKELEIENQELHADISKLKISHHEKIEKEREQSMRSIEFLKEQISLKDKRMDLLLNAVLEKDKHQKELLEKILGCPYGQKIMGE